MAPLKEINTEVFLFIDEAQKLPQIFDIVKILHDEYKIRILLSGSASLEIQKKGAESLAGRISYLYLMPFSIREILEDRVEKLPLPIWELFKEKDFVKILKERQAKLLKEEDWLRLFLRRMLLEGTLPAVYTAEDKEQKNLFLQSFCSVYLDREIRALREVGNLDDFTRVLLLLSFELGGLLNIASISKDLGLSINTLKKYISILLNTFLINLLPPHFKRQKGLIRAKKLYFLDVGVANFLAKRENLNQIDQVCALFENIIIKNFESYNKNRSMPFASYFFRDYAGYEIDLMIESAGTRVGVEISLAEEVSKDKLKSLLRLTKELKLETAVLVYQGRVKEVDLGTCKLICMPWWLWW